MSVVLLAVVVIAGMLVSLRVGIGLGRRERAAVIPPKPKPLEAICGCGHHLSTHDPADQQCHHKSREATKWDEYEDPTKYELVQCSCRRYVGPRPIDDLFAPGFLPLDAPPT